MLDIITRAVWGARSPKLTPRTIAIPTPELWLHHTASNSWHGASGMRAIQNLHMDDPDKRWNDIGYSFVVDDDGQAVYEARGTGVQGAHTENHNTISHGICVMINAETKTPAEATLAKVAELVRHGHKHGWWPATLTGGHKDVASTKCPGKHLYSKIAEINRLAQLEDPMATFSDVPVGSKYYNDIEYVAARGWMVGNKGKFHPLAEMTREQMAATLHRVALDIETATLQTLSAAKLRSTPAGLLGKAGELGQ